MSIKVKYHDSTEKSFNNFDEITDYQSVKIINCFGCNLKELPELPQGLQTLYCTGNYLITLPILPHGLQTLYCNGNQLTSLPTLPQGLQTLYCSYNKLTQLPTLPNTLKALYCSFNQLTTLPVSLLFCNRIINFHYSDNPLELTPQQINFIQLISDRNTQIDQHGYFNDTQNVHNSGLQKSLMTSIHNLLSY